MSDKQRNNCPDRNRRQRHKQASDRHHQSRLSGKRNEERRQRPSVTGRRPAGYRHLRVRDTWPRIVPTTDAEKRVVRETQKKMRRTGSRFDDDEQR